MAMGKQDPYAGLSCSSSSVSSSYTTPRNQKPYEKYIQEYVDKMSEQMKLSIDRDIIGMIKYVFRTKYKKEKLADSVYIKRLQSIPSMFDLSYNKIVRNYIELYTQRKRNQVELMLGMSEYLDSRLACLSYRPNDLFQTRWMALTL